MGLVRFWIRIRRRPCTQTFTQMRMALLAEAHLFAAMDFKSGGQTGGHLSGHRLLAENVFLYIWPVNFGKEIGSGNDNLLTDNITVTCSWQKSVPSQPYNGLDPQNLF